MTVQSRMCGNKVKYDTKETANMLMFAMKQECPHAEFSVYECPYCGAWHFGNKRRGKRKRRKHKGKTGRRGSMLWMITQN